VNAGALAGLAIMIGSEAATLAKLEPFYSWNTPICWTGFILFADSVVYRARRQSWMRSAPGEFALLAVASIPLWLVFEFYNLFLDNWNYTGLPGNWWLRMLGYAWAFATIWPAIFEGAELVGLAWDPAGRRGTGGARDISSADSNPAKAGSHLGVDSSPAKAGSHLRVDSNPPKAGSHLGVDSNPAKARSHVGVVLSIAVGAAMLVVPFVVPPAVARYMAAPVWLGFIFLLEPINRRLGADSLVPDGNVRRVWNLLLSGLLCGVLWEFWNYWSGAKWHYTVPILEHVKMFEMPLPGYLGFPPFALECFVMYVFVRVLVAGPRAGWPVAL
jgi:hypothetical protein